MVPEYNKAALGLHPLIPLYAVDCDENRSLCAEQVRSFVPVVCNFADVSSGREGLSDS